MRSSDMLELRLIAVKNKRQLPQMAGGECDKEIRATQAVGVGTGKFENKDEVWQKIQLKFVSFLHFLQSFSVLE